MAKLRIRGLCTSRLAPSRKGNELKQLALPAAICLVLLFCVVAAISAPAQSVAFTSLASFAGTNGANPQAPLVQATDGNFYGTTSNGGASNNCQHGCGTVFRMTAAGVVTTLHSFGGNDGSGPQAGLLQGADGNFYGTAYGGGAYNNGTVFRITRSGALTTLHSFNVTDGSGPVGMLVEASDGNFYGTTQFGGAFDFFGGTIFRITPSGTLTTLYSFCAQSGCTDGLDPLGGLVQASDGNFYGTTVLGGVNVGCGANSGCGTLFQITPAGTLTTLYSFCAQPNCTDGTLPGQPLMQASDGNLYGTTTDGGTGPQCLGYPGCGTIFRTTLAGTITTLYSFQGSPDGSLPSGRLVQASDGNFYGTTYTGGTGGNCQLNCGTVFKVTPDGVLTILHSFYGPDGSNPQSGVVLARDGSFYGTTSRGGTYGYGTVFRMGVVQACAICRPRAE